MERFYAEEQIMHCIGIHNINRAIIAHAYTNKCARDQKREREREDQRRNGQRQAERESTGGGGRSATSPPLAPRPRPSPPSSPPSLPIPSARNARFVTTAREVTQACPQQCQDEVMAAREVEVEQQQQRWDGQGSAETAHTLATKNNTKPVEDNRWAQRMLGLGANSLNSATATATATVDSIDPVDLDLNLRGTWWEQQQQHDWAQARMDNQLRKFVVALRLGGGVKGQGKWAAGLACPYARSSPTPLSPP